jgi:hypothetical protein
MIKINQENMEEGIFFVDIEDIDVDPFMYFDLESDNSPLIPSEMFVVSDRIDFPESETFVSNSTLRTYLNKNNTHCENVSFLRNFISFRVQDLLRKASIITNNMGRKIITQENVCLGMEL